MFSKEPAVIIGIIAEVARSIIPLLLVFGFIQWNDSQIGQVMLVIGVTVAAAEKLFTRSQVRPEAEVNELIETAIQSPKSTRVEAVKAAVEAKQ